MGAKRKNIGGAVSTGMLLVGFSLAMLPPVQLSVASAATPKQTTTTPEAVASETFTLRNTFAITMPSGWVAEGQEAEGYALITSYQPEGDLTPTDVKTEVLLVNEPPQTYVDREIDRLIQQGVVIDRFGVASVQGNDAFRIWIINMPGDFTNQVITFVGYENGSTAKIVSHYNDDSATTVETIMQMHRSFELISEAEYPD